jgi:chromosome partitioning protein
MANIIAVLNSKGGAGKTTLALHIAHALSSRENTVLVDSDPQGSARDWQEQRETPAFPVVGMDRASIDKDVMPIAKEYEWCVIDGSARIERQIAATIKIADLVVIPIQPSPLEFWAVQGLVETIKARQELTDGAPVAAFQVNRAKKHTQLAREVAAAIEALEVPMFHGAIHDRTVFARALINGTTALEATDDEARHEIQHLVKQILEAFQ